MTEDIINSLGRDIVFHDNILPEYREPWWLGFTENGPVPRRLENLHECLLAFTADQWRLEGIPRPTNLDGYTIEHSRELFIELQSIVCTKANACVCQMEQIREALGPGFRLQTLREVIQEARLFLPMSQSSATSSEDE